MKTFSRVIGFVLIFVALHGLGVPIQIQSTQKDAVVRSLAIQNQTGFEKGVGHAKSIYVVVYHHLSQPGLGGGMPPEPPFEVKTVIAGIKSLPFKVGSDTTIVKPIVEQLNSWGRFQVVSELSKADLVLMVDLGVDEQVDMFCKQSTSNQNENCHGRVQRDGSVSVYATNQDPGLIWRESQPPNKVNSGANLIPHFRRDVDKISP